jgi:5-methylthioribose kinase
VTDQLRLTEANLPEYLRKLEILPSGADAAIEPAGEGNINWVRRVRTSDGASWVGKQARPALERFPEHRVSTERAVFEARSGEVAAAFDDRGILVRIEHFDPVEKVLVLEDLGGAEPLSAALTRGDQAGVLDAASALGSFLGSVHRGTRDPQLARRFANDEMRRLHGDHIFSLPFRENDFPLSPALSARAGQLRANAQRLARIDAAYARYQEPVGALVHADVQPDNVLLAERGPVLLDAEIAHVGDPAFDLGLLIAHLLLTPVARGKRARAATAVGAAWSAYCDAHGVRDLVRFEDVARYAGIEMLRRTIGAARVGAVARDEAGLAVVDAGERLVDAPPSTIEELNA